MNEYKILIVEDDWDINALLKDILSARGYRVTSAFSGTEAELLFEREKFDIILLDLMLPGKDGESLIEQFRKTTAVPLIVISAKPGVQTRVHTLQLGADDFISKPFEPEEVVARVEAQLRRSNIFQKTQENEILRYKNCTVKQNAMQAFINGNLLSLTALEYQLLVTFICNPNRVFTRDKLFQLCWGDEYLGTDNTVDVHISHIRSKIAQLDGQEYISTIRGIGYRLAQE